MKNSELRILALDSTADVSSVAVCEGEKLLSEITINTGNTHSQTLLPSVEMALKLAELSVDDVDLFTCSVGIFYASDGVVITHSCIPFINFFFPFKRNGNALCIKAACVPL